MGRMFRWMGLLAVTTGGCVIGFDEYHAVCEPGTEEACYSGPAGSRVFQSTGRLALQAQQIGAAALDPDEDVIDKFDAAFFRALNDSAGALLHYPAGQFRKTIEGIAAIAEGETMNPLVLFVGPPKEKTN